MKKKTFGKKLESFWMFELLEYVRISSYIRFCFKFFFLIFESSVNSVILLKPSLQRPFCSQAGGFQMYNQETGEPVGNPLDYIREGLQFGKLSGGQQHLIYVLRQLG